MLSSPRRARKISKSELGSFCQKVRCYTTISSIIMRKAERAAGINIVNRTLTPRQRSTFISFKPGQLADAIDQNRCELSIPFQRLGTNHWLDRREVD